jgi:hypothetical protein
MSCRTKRVYHGGYRVGFRLGAPARPGACQSGHRFRPDREKNDAWQVAIAECMDAVMVGHDVAFAVLGSRYDDHHQAPSAGPR